MDIVGTKLILVTIGTSRVKKRQVERLQSEISTGFWHRPYTFLRNGEDLALYANLSLIISYRKFHVNDDYDDYDDDGNER